MFNKRRSSQDKLPFHKYTLKSSRRRKKWAWRFVILTVIILFFLGQHWRHNNTTSSTHASNSIKTHEDRFDANQDHFVIRLDSPDTQAVEGFKELELARGAQLTTVGPTIPKIVHFIYGLRDPEPTLDLIHAIAIKSAHDVLKPDKIMFHYHYLPVGENFERVRSLLTLNEVPLVGQVFGRTVNHYAHRADVVRLQVLEKFGGIYLDLDLISLKPLDHLLHHEFIMAQEGVDGSIGLCNAMIMARPHARFIQRWYATYASFDDADWNYHSVILPGKLAPHFSEEITVLNHTAFFWPLWDSHGLRSLYLEKSYDFSANLGTHIWESAANKNLMKDIDEKVIMEIDNSLYCQLRPFLLDGKPDPRSEACRILTHTERSDQLVGHWPLRKEDPMLDINPLPAKDISGNNLTGIIRNGKYDNEDNNGGIYLSGKTSYIFLTMPTETSVKSFTVSWWMKKAPGKKTKGQMAMVIQTYNGRICVETFILENGALSVQIKTIRRTDQWEWEQIQELVLRPSPYDIDDNKYHHYALVMEDKEVAQGRNEPPIVLYVDGYVAISSTDWSLPDYVDTTVHGLWFGSIEPLNDQYQNPWDDSVNLEAHYRDIHVWEKGLGANDVRRLFTASLPATETNKDEQKHDANTSKSKEPENKQDEDNEQVGIEEENDDDDELLWEADDQLDD